MYQVDIGFAPGRGYAAVIKDVMDKRVKTIRANSIRELCRHVHEAVCEDEQKKRRFPLEHEAQSVQQIITPESGDPFFNGL